MRAHKRLDVVVDSVAGEDPLMGHLRPPRQADLTTAAAIFRQGLTSRIITAKHAALAMMPARRGLIVEVTENDMIGGGGNPMSQTVKMAQKVLPLFWAAELAPHGITVMAVTPGFLRSESMLQHFGATEENWREGEEGSKFPALRSPLFVGRAIAALAADPGVRERTGMALRLVGARARLRLHRLRRPSARLGARPDRFLRPPADADRAVPHRRRPGNPWLTTLAARARKFRAKVP